MTPTPATPCIDAAITQLQRGAEAIYSIDELRRKLARSAETGKPLRIKLGLDPTAPDIHLGHTVVLRKMRQFQDLGHKAILLIGDYTSKIGDPTGRDTTRPILDDQTIAANAQTYLDQAGKVLDTSPEKLELRRNSEWLGKLTFADVLRLTGQLTVQQMLHRDNFKKRMADEKEIMISEFMYPLMQAYDSVALEADVELGGSDQTFNCLMGRQLMEKQGLPKQIVLTMPILVGLDGVEKMSKSKGNYIGVTDEPNDMFGKVMSIPDALMSNYYTLLTTVDEGEIAALCDGARTHPRDAKDRLGQAIVETFHNAAGAAGASAEFKSRFAEGNLPEDLETKTSPSSPIGIVALVKHVGFASSNGEARRLVQQGGVSFAEAKVTDHAAEVEIPTDGAILKVGKRRICRIFPE